MSDENTQPVVVTVPQRGERGRYLPGSTGNPGGRGRPIENWRGWLRRNTEEGTEIHKILLSLARGEARVIKRPDGAELTLVPTPEVSARCAIHLDEMLHGKAVTQNEQQAAEREASALQAVRALSYEELARRASQALARGTAESDAELISSGSEALEIYNAPPQRVPGATLPLEDD